MAPAYRPQPHAGAAISVMLPLEDGQIAFGDCVDVILSGLTRRISIRSPIAERSLGSAA